MKGVVIILLFINVFILVLHAQNKRPFNASDLTQLKKLKAKVETDPSNLAAHQAYIQFFKIDDPKLEVQYNTWIKMIKETLAEKD